MFPINLYQKINLPVDELMEVLIQEAEEEGMNPDESYGFAAAIVKYLDCEESKEALAAISANGPTAAAKAKTIFTPHLKLVK